MKKTASVCILGGALLAACAGSPKNIAEPEGGDGWLELPSAHFVLRTDLDAKEATRVSAKLEEAYEAVSTLGFESTAPPSFTIDVVYFRDAKAFAEFAPLGVVGFFRRADLHDFERRPIAVLGGDFVDATRATVQHELTHMFVATYYPQIPVWMNEGLARYLETIQIEDGVATVGRAPRDSRFWRGAWGYDSRSGVSNMPVGQAPTAASLRAMTPTEFYGFSTRARYRDDDAHKVTAIHYQAAWCFVHMLLESPKYAPTFARYLERIHNGERDGAAWSSTVGSLDPGELEADYKAALMPSEVTLLRSKYSSQPPSAPQVAMMSRGSVHVLLARLRDWNSEAGRKAAEADLADARREGPSPEVTKLEAMWALQAKNGKLAEELVRAAVARDDADPTLWNALGWIVVHDSRGTTPEQRAAALAPIAAKLAPIAKSAAQLDLLGNERLLANKPDEALAYEKRALAIDSNCVDCLATTAGAFLEKGMPSDALDVANLGLGVAGEGSRPGRLMAIAEHAQRAIHQRESNAPGENSAHVGASSECTPYAPSVAKPGDDSPVSPSATMTRPTLLCVPTLTYSIEAIRAKVSGLALGKCTINVDGTVSDCKLVKSLPFMDASLLEAFRSMRYTPVLVDGKPRRVEMTIPLRVPEPKAREAK